VKRVAELARRQGGVVSRAQLLEVEVSNGDIGRWTTEGRIHRLHPAVYTVGHTAIGIRGRLVAALLYAGAESAFSHQTAAYVWKLTPTQPSRVHVTTPRDRKSLKAIAVHRAETTAVRTAGFPVTTIERTLLDLAATLTREALRKILAEADYRHILHPARLFLELGRGRAGSRALRAALLDHLPELARAGEGVEERFLLLCERNAIAIPEVNVAVEGFKVDCLWRARRVVAELDSALAHSQPGKVEADHHRDLTLRRAGYTVRRYTWHQVTHQSEAVVADLRSALRPS
jgi:hypothetical protein